MIKKYYLPILTIGAALLSLASCDSDPIDVGSEVLTSTTFSQLRVEDDSVTSQHQDLNQLQTNDYNGNRFLGTSDRSATTGTTSYGLLCRVNPTTSTALTEVVAGQTIQSISLKRAELILPYHYELIEVISDTINRYRIIGGEIKQGQELALEVFRSNHDIITSSTSTNTRQRYFANATTLNPSSELFSIAADIEAGGDIVESVIDNIPTAEEFEIQVANTDENNRVDPIGRDTISNAFEQEGRTLRIQLKRDFLGDSFTDANGVVINPDLFTTSAFYENFKGIYLKPTVTNTNLVEINPSFANVPLKVEITFDIELLVEEQNGEGESAVTTTSMQTKTETLDFVINQNLLISTITPTNIAAFESAVASDENIVIKSGVSASVISIFQETDTAIKIFEQDPIINNATLRLYVNEDSPLYDEDRVPEFLWLNFLQTGNLLSGAALQDGETPFYEFTLTQYMRQVMNSENEEQLLNQEFDFMLGVSNDDVDEEVSAFDDPLPANNLQNLSVFESSREQRISVGSILTLNELPLHGSGALNAELRPQLVVEFSTLN